MHVYFFLVEHSSLNRSVIKVPCVACKCNSLVVKYSPKEKYVGNNMQQPILERQYCHLHPTINVSICYARTSLVFPRKLTPLPVMVRNNNIVLLGWPSLGMGCDLLTLGHNSFLWRYNNACCGNMKRTPPSIFDSVLYLG